MQRQERKRHEAPKRPVPDTPRKTVQERAPDRRIARTREALREALIDLIVERGWDAIAVSDVCERANVGRSTFYTHFADKEELLLAGLHDMRKELRARRSGAAPDPLGFARGLIEHVHERQQLFRAVVGKRAGHFIEWQFRGLVIAMVKDDLAAVVRKPHLGAAVHYVAGALVQLLVFSLEGLEPMDPVAVEALFRRLTTPVLGALESMA
jgi:AcrR family transcriptional regulator